MNLHDRTLKIFIFFLNFSLFCCIFFFLFQFGVVALILSFFFWFFLIFVENTKSVFLYIFVYNRHDLPYTSAARDRTKCSLVEHLTFMPLCRKGNLLQLHTQHNSTTIAVKQRWQTNNAGNGVWVWVRMCASLVSVGSSFQHHSEQTGLYGIYSCCYYNIHTHTQKNTRPYEDTSVQYVCLMWV